MRGTIAAALCAVAAATPATALANGPDPVNQPLQDGCQRNPAGLLSYTSPEWVWVNAAHMDTATTDSTRVIEGSSTLVHTADEDLPESHNSYDLDFDVKPDPAYVDLLAGHPGSNNGNWSTPADADYGKLHVEWESDTVPTFAWPTEGDRVKVWGQWSWDCGHWGEGIETDPSNPEGDFVGTGDYFLPGQGPDLPGGLPLVPPLNQAASNLRGEQTELHPMQAIVDTRRASGQAPGNETETDAFISNQGTHAYDEVRCAKASTNVQQKSEGPDFTACVNNPGNTHLEPLGGRSYEFFAPAPPKPSPGARMTYRETNPMGSDSGAYSEQVIQRANGLDVTVTLGPDATHPLTFARSFFVGWQRDRSPAPARLDLLLKSIQVVHSLDPNRSRPQQTGPPPGEYNLYLDVNGNWRFIGGRGRAFAVQGEWAPDLGNVSDGQTVTVNKTVGFFVPQGAPVRLQFSGRECDLPKMDPCVETGEVSDGNDHPGYATATFPSAAAALGDHEVQPPGDDPDYKVLYSIARGSGPATPPGASGVPSNPGARAARCPGDRIAPRSSLRVRHAHRRVVARGRAHDRGCRAKVARVTVAIAKRSAHRRCRWVQANGRLGRARSCRAPVYLPARGGARWSLRLRRRLPRGTYVIRSRAIDVAGNVERKRRLRGRLRNFRTVVLR